MTNQLLRKASGRRVDIKRRLRKAAILNALREQGRLSCSELAQSTGFTLPVVSRLVRELGHEGFVEIAKADFSTGGRPPVMVELKPRAKFVLGVDLGRSTTRFVVVDINQSLIIESETHIDLVRNDMSVLEHLKTKIDELLYQANLDKCQLLGVGLAIPGLVDSRTGRSESYLNFGEKTVRELFEEMLRVPVRVENDARAMALAEKWFGLAKQAENALCLNIGWGVGLGIILNRQIYYGASSFAGEFGHIVVEEDGLLCQCGKRGCLETVASGTVIGRTAREHLRGGSLTKMREMVDEIEAASAETVVRAAVQGDQLAIEIFEQAGTSLGKSLAILINLFNPEMIILNGGITTAGQFLLNPIRAAAFKHALPHIARNVKIVVSELGAKAGAIGAATLIKREIFETSHLDLTPFV